MIALPGDPLPDTHGKVVDQDHVQIFCPTAAPHPRGTLYNSNSPEEAVETHKPGRPCNLDSGSKGYTWHK